MRWQELTNQRSMPKTSTYTGFYRKLLQPTNLHYAYIRAILIPVHIEPFYMPLGGPRIWKLAAHEFNKVKLPYWRDMCEFFASRYEKINDLRT